MTPKKYDFAYSKKVRKALWAFLIIVLALFAIRIVYVRIEAKNRAAEIEERERLYGALPKLESARLNSLTKLALTSNVSLSAVTLDDIEITVGGAEFPEKFITGFSHDEYNDKICYVSLDPFTFEEVNVSNLKVTMWYDGETYEELSKSVYTNSASVHSIWGVVSNSNTNYPNTPPYRNAWANITENTPIKLGEPFVTHRITNNYFQKGVLKAAMMVIDFPDARAADNDGKFIGVNGEQDYGNRLNGNVLKTASDYFNYLAPEADKYFKTVSYGQTGYDITLIENPTAQNGVFTLEKNLFEGENAYINDKDEDGFNYEYIYDAAVLARSELLAAADEYEVLIIVTAENAAAVSASFSNDEGAVINAIANKEHYKGVIALNSAYITELIHETAHLMGLPDLYVESFNGNGSSGFETFPIDIMGNPSYGNDFLGYFKWKFGWINDEQVDVISNVGTTLHELYPVETPGGTKLLLIPGNEAGLPYSNAPAGTERGFSYVIEYKQPAGIRDANAIDEYYDNLAKNGNIDRLEDKFQVFGGLVLYKVDARSTSAAGSVILTNLTPERNDDVLKNILRESVMGENTGIYSCIDEAVGFYIEIIRDGSLEAGEPVKVRITRFNPAFVPDQGYVQRKPVLSQAHFIDFNTLEFKTNVDLRGITAADIRVHKGDRRIPVEINRITSTSVRVTLKDSGFNHISDLSGCVVYTTAFAFFEPGDSVEILPFKVNNSYRLEDLRFTSLTEITAKSTEDISGISKSDMVIHANGYILSDFYIEEVTFDRKTGDLKITLSELAFRTREETIGAEIDIGIVTDFDSQAEMNYYSRFDPKINIYSAHRQDIRALDERSGL